MENEILDTELENDTPTADDETVDESTVDVPERDDEFEYDEDGNIIIPEPVYDDEDDEEIAIDDADEDEGDTEAEEEAEEEESTETSSEPETPDERDAEIERLRRQISEMESQAKDTLTKLGVKSDDTLKGLAELAAEADGKQVDEYLKERTDAADLAAAQKMLKEQAYERMIAADLAAIHAAYPETKKYKSVEEFPNFKRFGELRDKGNTPEEAFRATHPKEIVEGAVRSARQQSLNDTKNHLKSNVPKKSGGESITMPKKTLVEWRDLFPNKTDKEIIALYKETYSK